VRLDRELTLRLFGPLSSSRKEHLPILMYHSVSGDDPETHLRPYYRVSTNPQRFAEQMEWLHELGYCAVSLEEALATRNSNANETRLVAITFDDGFRDLFTAAWPVLQRYKFTATAYLPTAFISGRRKSWLNRDCLTWDEVRDLHNQGVRFGSHTVNHPKLYEMPWKEIERELSDSKTHIEQELGKRVSSLAYPFAFPQEDSRFTKRLTETIRACGYESCVTTAIGRLNAADDPVLLGRVPVNGSDDRALFAAKLIGAYDWMARPQRFIRQSKSWIGQTRRRID